MKLPQQTLPFGLGVLLVACGAAGTGEQAADNEATEAQIDVATLVAQLEDSQASEWSTAIRTLGDAGAVAVPALVEALDSPNDDLRLGASQALLRIGPAAAPAVPKLMELVDGDDGFGLALATLAAIGPAARDAAPMALDLLQHSESFTQRTRAVEVIAAVLPIEEATPTLLAALDDEWGGVREKAVWELKQREVVTPEAVAAYIRLLTESDTSTRNHAANALVPAAPQDEEAVTRLTAMLHADDTLSREAAAKALGAIGPPLAIAAKDDLINCLDHEMYQVRKAAGEALGRLGEPAAEAIPKLIALLDHSDSWWQVGAAEGLAGFGPLAADALPALEKLVDHPELPVKWGARKAIERIQGNES